MDRLFVRYFMIVALALAATNALKARAAEPSGRVGGSLLVEQARAPA